MGKFNPNEICHVVFNTETGETSIFPDDHYQKYKSSTFRSRFKGTRQECINWMKDREPNGLHDSLTEIKEQLFDAPVEVKEAFNSIVGYFDTNSDLYEIQALDLDSGGIISSRRRGISKSEVLKSFKEAPANRIKNLKYIKVFKYPEEKSLQQEHYNELRSYS